MPLIEYDAAFGLAFADQYDEVPEGSPLDKFILDAEALRMAVRACNERN